MFVILNTILTRNPEFKFVDVIHINKMVDQAMERYCAENKIPIIDKSLFFSEKSSIYSGTSAYLARVCVENLLNYSKKADFGSDMLESTDLNCQVS